MDVDREPAWLHRRDVFLSSGARMVLTQDRDRELVVRLLAVEEDGRRWRYRTPKRRVEQAFLTSLLQPFDQIREVGELTIQLEGDAATVRLDGQLAGWAPRVRFVSDLRAFLDEVVAVHP